MRQDYPPIQHRALSTAAALLLLCPILGLLCGCGTNQAGRSNSTSTEPAYASEPFTHQQQRVEQGARLFVADGCSACHAISGKSDIGPSFSRFAGHAVTLVNGRRVIVDEHFLLEALTEPGETQIKGYPLAPMLEAIRRLHLNRHPEQLAALVAFIEQVGPETG